MSTTLHMIHASGDTFMSLAKEKSDIGNLLKRRALAYTITECGEAVTIQALREEVHKHDAPYHVINPDEGDIAFIVHHDVKILSQGGPLAIPAQHGPASQGGHGPRCNSFFEGEYKGETFTKFGVHFVTAHTLHDGPNKGVWRTDEQVKQADLLGQQMNAAAKGSHLAIGSGDLNAVLPNNRDVQAVFDRYGMTTTAQETGVMTGTHGNTRIDYMWTMDRDKRLSVTKMKVLKSKIYNSDHDPVEVFMEVR